MNERSTDSLHGEIFYFEGAGESFDATPSKQSHSKKASSRPVGSIQKESAVTAAQSNDNLIDERDQSNSLVAWSQKAILDAKQSKKIIKNSTADDKN